MGQICSNVCNKVFGNESSVSVSEINDPLHADDGLHEDNYSDVNEVNENHCDHTIPKHYIEDDSCKEDAIFTPVQVISEYVSPRPPLENYRKRNSIDTTLEINKKIKVELEDYLNFPILKDSFTCTFINKSQVC